MATNINLITHPAHLLLGSYQHMLPALISALKSALCTNHGCNHCITCIKIQNNNHQSIQWLKPENNYTKEDLEPLFHTSSFALEHEEHFFFIIEKADYFNQACANSLLKILEEPPIGYHFILLAQREEYINPTIRSRCLIKTFPRQEAHEIHEITSWFMTLQFPDSATFLHTIDQSTISNRESLEMLDTIFEHWLKNQKESIQKNDPLKIKKIKQMLAILQETFENPPMPGSSKLFWKNLFLQFQFRDNI